MTQASDACFLFAVWNLLVWKQAYSWGFSLGMRWPPCWWVPGECQLNEALNELEGKNGLSLMWPQMSMAPVWLQMWFQDYAATQLKLISSKIGAKYFTVLPMKVKNPASLLIKDFMFECVLKKAKTRKGDIFWQNWVWKGAPPQKKIREKFLYFELVTHRLSVQCWVKRIIEEAHGLFTFASFITTGFSQRQTFNNSTEFI